MGDRPEEGMCGGVCDQRKVPKCKLATRGGRAAEGNGIQTLCACLYATRTSAQACDADHAGLRRQAGQHALQPGGGQLVQVQEGVRAGRGRGSCTPRLGAAAAGLRGCQHEAQRALRQLGQLQGGRGYAVKYRGWTWRDK